MFKYREKDNKEVKKIEIMTDNQTLIDVIITLCKNLNKAEQYDNLMNGRIGRSDNQNICLCEEYSPEEVFDIIYRNQHTKQKVVILLSDFLSIDRKTASKMYDTEYLIYKKRRLTNCV